MNTQILINQYNFPCLYNCLSYENKTNSTFSLSKVRIKIGTFLLQEFKFYDKRVILQIYTYVYAKVTNLCIISEYTPYCTSVCIKDVNQYKIS